MLEELNRAQDLTSEDYNGILIKTAKINNGKGTKVSDILGWDVILSDKESRCWECYMTDHPLTGITRPTPTQNPMGIVRFNDYSIKIEEAIKLFQSQNGLNTFTSITLCWQLTYPMQTEPTWYFTSECGHHVTVGANSSVVNNSRISKETVLGSVNYYKGFV